MYQKVTKSDRQNMYYPPKKMICTVIVIKHL